MSEEIQVSQSIRFSPEIGQLFAALAAAQLKFATIIKNKKNPHTNSMYADLQSIVAATQPALAEQSVAIIQLPVVRGRDAGCFSRLAHKSGEFVECELLLPTSMPGRAEKFDAQSIGSAITYSKRYSYTGLVGAVAEDDDDGNAAAETQTQQNKPVAAKSSARPDAVKAPGPVNSAPATQGTRPETGQKGSSEVYAAKDKVVVDGVVVKDRDNAPTNAQAADLPQDSAPTETLPTNEPSSPLPSLEQFEAFKKRATDLRVVLEKSGLKPSAKTGSSPAMSSGAKLVKYFTLTAGVQKLDDLNTSQWNTVFSVLDALVNSNPAKAVELIEEKIRG